MASLVSTVRSALDPSGLRASEAKAVKAFIEAFYGSDKKKATVEDITASAASVLATLAIVVAKIGQTTEPLAIASPAGKGLRLANARGHDFDSQRIAAIGDVSTGNVRMVQVGTDHLKKAATKAATKADEAAPKAE